MSEQNGNSSSTTSSLIQTLRPMALNSQVILFAIQAAVRLESQMKSAQIEHIKQHTVNLVTPKFNGLINVRSASTWFLGDGKNSIISDKRLQELVQKARFDVRNMTSEEKKELKDAYIRIRNLDGGHVKFDGVNLSKANIFALTDIKQWEDGTNPNPSPIQRIAGSLIEVGVDYFKNFSHLATTSSSQGKILMSFLDAIDEVDFAEGQLDSIATSFMTATLETFTAETNFLGGDANSASLLKSVAKGVISDVNNYINADGANNLLKQTDAKEWGQLIFKSVLNSAGTEVFGNPTKFLGTGDGASEMVTSVGNSLLNSILTDVDAGDGVVVSLKNVFTAETLDTITKSSLQVLAEHPEWYDIDNEGLQNILTALIETVADYPSQFGLDMIPNLANLVLNQTVGNLNLIYQGDPSNPANNLLIKATGLVLKTLQSAVPTEPGQRWQPVFTKSQTLDLIDAVMQEVVTNPEWVLSEASGVSPMLEDVLSAVFKSLQGVSVSSINTATKMNIVRAAIDAVAINQGLLDKFNIDGEEKQLIDYGIDIVLSFAFGDKATAKTRWALASSDALNMMIEAVLVRLAGQGASEEVIGLTKQFLEAEMQALTNGEGVNVKDIAQRLKSGDTIQELLQNSFNAVTRISATIIADNPGLIKIENTGVQNIISYLVDTLKDYPTDLTTAMLPQMGMMIITQTSANLGTIAGATADEPAKNLLVMTGQTVLNALATQDENGKVTFNFTSKQAMNLMDSVFQTVINNSEFVLTAAGEKSPILEDALSAVMSSFNGVSLQNMTNDTKIGIIKSAVSAVALRQDLLAKVNIDEEETTLLSGGIEMALSLAFGEKASAQAKWALMSGDVMNEMVNAILYRVAKEGASQDVLDLTRGFLNDEINALTDGQPFNVQDVISKLKSPDTLDELLQNSFNAVTRISATIIADNPGLIKIENSGVQNIISYLVDTLKDYPTDLTTAMLPQMGMMIITQTSANLGTIAGATADEPAKNLLVMTGQTVLNALATQDESGKVTFNFTSKQAMNLMDSVFQTVINNSEFVLTAAGEKSPILEDALSAVMSSFNGVSLQNMTNDTKIGIIKSAVSAVALRQDLLAKVNIDEEETTLLSGGIEMALSLAFGEKASAQAKWALMSGDVMNEMVNAILYRVAKEGASQDVLDLTRGFLNDEINALTDGQPFNVQDVISKLKSQDTLDELLQNSFNAVTRISATIIADNPGLIKIENTGVQNIISYLVDTLKGYPTDLTTAMLPQMGMMIITQTSANLGTIAGATADEPAKNLLVMTGQTVLNALATEDENGKVTFNFTSKQAMNLMDSIFQNVINNPEFILTAAGEKSLILEDALSAVMSSLNGVSLQNMTNDTKINIIKSAVGAVALRQDLLAKANIDEEETTLLSGGIEIALNLAFGDKANAQAKWALMSGDVMDEMVNAVLYRVAKEGASQEVLDLTRSFLDGEINGLTDGQPFDVQSVISKLKSEDGLQSLLSNSLDAVTRISATLLMENADNLGIENESVKGLVSHLSSTLAKYPDAFGKAMLPDLARMIILDTSENLGVILAGSSDNPSENLLVQASQIVFDTLLPVDENGNISMKFSSAQLLDLTDSVVQLVASKPSWVLSKAENVDPLLSTALSAVMTTLDGASVLSLSGEAKVNILRSALTAVGQDKGFMEAVGIESEFMMNMAINAVLNAAQGKLTGDDSGGAGLDLTTEGLTKLLTDTAKENIQWALSDNSTIETLSDAVLSRVIQEGTSEETIQLTNTLIASEVIKIAKGEPFSLSALVEKLESPEQLADIIAAFTSAEVTTQPAVGDQTTSDATNEPTIVESPVVDETTPEDGGTSADPTIND